MTVVAGKLFPIVYASKINPFSTAYQALFVFGEIPRNQGMTPFTELWAVHAIPVRFGQDRYTG